MPLIARVLALLFTIYILYFHGLGAVGLLGPDEPRYASIGREMARSGDWITPRLLGEGWFEKPALLYWMTGLGFRLGLPLDLAPRLPVALWSVLFLAAFYWLLREETDAATAGYATAILSTSALWLAYSHIAVTDLPLAACFALSVLLTLRWLRTESRLALVLAGVAMGGAVLAKGLVPLVLAVPLVWFARRRLLTVWPGLVALIAVAAPWYVLVTMANGSAFIDEFFWKHHFGRFSSGELQHVQPVWFYVPVLLGALFPWTPLLGLMRTPFTGATRRVVAVLFLFGLLFFSLAQNKLPGYVLPLLPLGAILMGQDLARAQVGARIPLVVSAALLGIVPTILPGLPEAIESGATKAVGLVEWQLAPLAMVVLGAGAYAVQRWLGSGRAVALIVLLVAGCVLLITRQTFPVLDEQVSARGKAAAVRGRENEVCLDAPHRAFQYGMNYYTVLPLPLCADEPRAVRVR